MTRLASVSLFFVFLMPLLGGAIASAQTSGTFVQIGPLPGTNSASAAPGSTVNIPVSILGTAGIMPRVDAQIMVPTPLRLLESSYCSAETAQAVREANFEPKSCHITSQPQSDKSQLISAQIEGLGTLEVFRINATIIVEIPSNAPAGSEYTLSSLNHDLYRSPSRFTVEVSENPAISISPSMSSLPDLSPSGPLHDIDGSALDFPVGSIHPFSFGISYDAYREATSASLILYADTGHIDVSDPSVVDWRASYTCYKDPGTEYNSRARKRSIAVLPTAFNLSLGRWIEPGSQIRVCAEIVYYNGSNMLAVERHISVITVRE